MPEAPAAPETLPATRAITLAILAMGGEGGGVLADWLVDAAEASDFVAQSTSVPGVAQRTGATIYYLEFFPAAEARAAGRDPVLALMPAPGNVDVVIASELMEAGRAVQRGLVSPEHGTFILSTHRVFAMTEKIAMGDGRVDATALLRTCHAAAQRVVAADMQALAEAAGAHLSAVLLGAVAGSGALPVPRAAFEEAIRRAGVGVEASLRGFTAGFDAAREPAAPPPLIDAETKATEPDAESIILEGVHRLTDYQDDAYARLYRERLDRLRLDGTLRAETARHLALWMSYEDTIRVADLKTRASRLSRVRAEVRARPDQVVRITEFMHPRPQEIADTLPAPLGRWVLRARAPRRLLELLTARGRRIETTSVAGFLLLRGIAALRPFRRRTLRHAEEQARIEAWLARIGALASRDPDLALEVARCQGLVKGYGETHARGWANFQRLMAEADRRAGTRGASARLATLRAAALADENGQALAKALEAA
ncbi:MAG TPA: indolepyruvate oxidoreductase subunit beta family protein [Acetobacteraceae bacterium]|nr:indolepyruvate oxidoreductase subunit beta family protein [Acetobacteraceae bacterium]